MLGHNWCAKARYALQSQDGALANVPRFIAASKKMSSGQAHAPSDGWLEIFRRNGMERRIVLTNARLIPQKGLKCLIEAMRGMDADLVIFGRGPLKWQSLRPKRDRAPRETLFLASVSGEPNLTSTLHSADLFVLPSLYEPCSVALLEAMGCGKPITATDVGSNRTHPGWEKRSDCSSALLEGPA